MTLKEFKALVDYVIEDTRNLENPKIVFMQYDASDEKAVFDVCDASEKKERYAYELYNVYD